MNEDQNTYKTVLKIYKCMTALGIINGSDEYNTQNIQKANCMGHILCRIWFLKHCVGRKVEEISDGKRRKKT
jgi:hypothetical protein